MTPGQICAVVNTALQQYEAGEKHSNLATPPSDSSTIHKIRGFSDEERGDLFKLAECFLQEPLVAGSGTEQVFFAILRESLPRINKRVHIPANVSWEAVAGEASPEYPLNQSDLQLVSRTLYLLRSKELLDEENFSKFIRRSGLISFCSGVQMLSDSDILDQNSLAACFSYDHPIHLVNELLCFPGLARLLTTPENWATVMSQRTKTTSTHNCDQVPPLPPLPPPPHHHHHHLLHLHRLHYLRLPLSPPQRLHNVVAALSMLYQAGLLTSENQAAVMAHLDSRGLNKALYLLKQARLLTPENLAAVMAHVQLWHLAGILTTLRQTNLLDQENLSQVCKINCDYLIFEDCIDLVWWRIPENLRTQEIFNQIVAIITAPDATIPRHAYEEDMNALVRRVLDEAKDLPDRAVSNPDTTIQSIEKAMHASVQKVLEAKNLPDRAADVFNRAQNTPTVSDVHRNSTSELARRFERCTRRFACSNFGQKVQAAVAFFVPSNSRDGYSRLRGEDDEHQELEENTIRVLP
jgi:hypothetical protein